MANGSDGGHTAAVAEPRTMTPDLLGQAVGPVLDHPDVRAKRSLLALLERQAAETGRQCAEQLRRLRAAEPGEPDDDVRRKLLDCGDIEASSAAVLDVQLQ